MPFAPKDSTVSFSGRPLLAQSAGGSANAGLPRSWIGTAVACSSAMTTSVLTTGPHT
jgi:hypothetical protein